MGTYIEDNTRFEWIPVIHSACGGQGCGQCGHTGEELVRVDVTAA